MNRRKLIGCVLLSLLGATVTAAVSAPSPARVQLEGFLTAFNSGDRTTLIAFGKDHAPPDFLRPAIIDQTIEMYRKSGGYDLLEVDESDPLSLRSWIRGRASRKVVLLSVEVDAASPERIRVVTFQSEDVPQRFHSKE